MEFIAKYWLEVFFGLIVTFLGFVMKQLSKRIRDESLKNKAVEQGLQALLRDRIVQAYYHYTDNEYITLHGLEAVEKMYEEYHNLNGNGTVTKLITDLRKLQVEDK